MITPIPGKASGNSMPKKMARKIHEIIAEFKLERIIFSDKLWNTIEKRRPTSNRTRK
jgi:hypothetical protein